PGVRVVRVLGQERLRREHDPSAPTVFREGLADDALALSARVRVRRIDEVDALADGMLDDVDGLGLAGAPAEHHRAEAKRAHLDAGAAEIAVLHRRPLRFDGWIAPFYPPR